MQIISNNLSFTYNKKSIMETTAIKDINLTINEGDFLGIIGHTGSGKSTFIQHLNALIDIQEGCIKIGDTTLIPSKNSKKLAHKNSKSLFNLRRNVGMVFQYPEYQLFAETVFLDVAFGYKNFYPDATEADIQINVQRALELVGLDYNEIKDASPFDLSGGQKRRVAIAGVIVTKPSILILDEPVAGLDPLGKKQLMQLLKHLFNSSVQTIIIVSHDMDEVLENCNRVICFNKGQVVLDGKPNEVYKNAELLSDIKLDLPLIAKLTSSLKASGFDIQNDLTLKGFTTAIANSLASKNSD